jgi:uncharacterized heparinase superfamily protein
LWRSSAFDNLACVEGGAIELLGRRVEYPPLSWSSPELDRLRRFHLHYGDEVLAAARRDDVELARLAIRSWIASNPPRPGDAWHPYPLSTRIGNWIAAAALKPELSDAATATSLRRQLAYLERNVEEDVLGNHVIRNARALVLGGLAFGDGRLLQRGIGLLRRELPEQVLPDGGHYERSPVYHLVVLRDLLEIRAAAGLDWLDETIARMERFAAALTRPDGAPALFNDGGLDLAPRLKLPTPSQGLSVFRQTGYAVVREGPFCLAFDCGPPAPAFLPAHAHADALSIQLWWEGRPVLVDSGTFTYEPGPDRDWFRSTAAHSTVSVDGGSQFEPWGAFRSGPLPDVRLLRAEHGALEATVPWPGGIRHLRRLEWAGDELTIRDRVEGGGRHLLDNRLVLASAPGVEIEPLEGDAQIEEGWVSELFGERTRTRVEVQRRLTSLPAESGWRVRFAQEPGASGAHRTGR